MMPMPKMAGFSTSAEAVVINASRSPSERSRPSSRRRCDIRRTQFSTMMMAPSTIRPKSMAPRLIRLAETLKYFIPIRAISMERGIALLTIRPARICSRKRKRIATTSRPPSSRFLVAVCRVRSMREERSRKPISRTPGGSDFWMEATLSLTRSTTTRPFSPISSMAMAKTCSPLPSAVNAPCRIAAPKATSATSPTNTGAPSSTASTMLRMSSRL